MTLSQLSVQDDASAALVAGRLAQLRLAPVSYTHLTGSVVKRQRFVRDAARLSLAPHRRKDLKIAAALRHGVAVLLEVCLLYTSIAPIISNPSLPI